MIKVIITSIFTALFLNLFSQGLIPTSVSKLKNLYPEKEYKFSTTKKAIILPLVVDYSDGFQKEPINQYPSGTCVACAVAHLKTYQLGKLIGWDIDDKAHQVSPAYIYNSVHIPGDIPGLATPDALIFTVNSGSLFMNEMPFIPMDERRPNVSLEYKALKSRNTDWGFIDYGKDISKIKECLIYKGPLIMDMMGGGFGHCVCAVGYNDTVKIDGGYVGGIMYIDSYGLNWKSSNPNARQIKEKPGYSWIPYSYLVSKDFRFDFTYLENKIQKPKNTLVLKLNSNFRATRGFWTSGEIKIISSGDTLSFEKDPMYYEDKPAGKTAGIIGCLDRTKEISLVLDKDNIDSLKTFDIFVSKEQIICPTKSTSQLYVDSVFVFDEISSKFKNLNVRIVEEKSSYGKYKDTDVRIDSLQISISIKKEIPTKNFLVKNNNLNVYPNPTLGLVNVENVPLNSPIYIFDVNGRILFRKIADNQSIQIDLSSFPSGLYLLKTQNITKKLLKK